MDEKVSDMIVDFCVIISRIKYTLIWAIVTIIIASTTLPVLKPISNGEITQDPGMKLLLILTISILNVLCIGIMCILWNPHHIRLCNDVIERIEIQRYEKQNVKTTKYEK